MIEMVHENSINYRTIWESGQNYYLHNVIVFIYQVESVISTLLLYNVW